MTLPTLRILCFGNSLTSGFWHYGLESHPYAGKLKEKLESADIDLFPGINTRTKNPRILIDVDGMPGDLVVTPPGCFLGRMKARCSKNTYDWVIVLGGTNDLGYGSFSSQQIFSALQESWSTALNNSASTQILALTIPECAVVSDRLTGRRNALNASILAHSGERFHTFDLHSVLPYHAMSEEDRERFWDDGLHLTDKGYDLMGELIADRLVELLELKKEGNAELGVGSGLGSKKEAGDGLGAAEPEGGWRN